MSIKSIVKYAFLIATVYYSVRLSVCLYTFLKNIFDVSSRTTVSNVKSESFFNLEMKNTNCTIRMCVLKKNLLKNLLLQSHQTKKAIFYNKACICNENSKFLKQSPQNQYSFFAIKQSNWILKIKYMFKAFNGSSYHSGFE